MNKINVKDKKLISIILILTISVLVLAYLNYSSMKLEISEAEKGTLLISADNKSIILNIEDIKAMNFNTFSAIQDTSASEPTKQEYKGVMLRDVIKLLIPQLEKISYTKVIVKGIDSYTVAISLEEVMQEDNIYLAFERNGKSLGTKKRGGTGPYQLIIRNDQFSQRWCKYVSEVILQ